MALDLSHDSPREELPFWIAWSLEGPRSAGHSRPTGTGHLLALIPARVSEAAKPPARNEQCCAAPMTEVGAVLHAGAPYSDRPASGRRDRRRRTRPHCAGTRPRDERPPHRPQHPVADGSRLDCRRLLVAADSTSERRSHETGWRHTCPRARRGRHRVPGGR